VNAVLRDKALDVWISRRWNVMTKAELVAQVAAKTQMTQQQTAQVVNLFFTSIMEALQTGDKVELRGFGSFRRRGRRPRQARNPKTGDAIEVPAQIVPFFTAGQQLRVRLNPQLTPSSVLRRA
jgi:integration host factor subunit beta